MKTFFKLLGILVALVIVLVIGAVVYVTQFLPAIPVDAGIAVEVTPERVERGRYLANSVAVCMDCHSTRDKTLFAAPMKAGTLGEGGERFDQTMGFPGSFVASNITPHGIGSWSDGEVYRAITSGVSRDGRPLFPIMPYPAYGKMTKEDVFSIIAYLRTLPSLPNVPAVSKADPPVNVILHLMPKAGTPATAIPAKTDRAAYGGYLTNAAGCTECHTKMEKGTPVGEPFAGGFEFPMPGGTVRSANITPHAVTGIGAWTKEVFVARFKASAAEGYQAPKVEAGQMQTVMPWTMYAGMTEEDLGAIFDYIQTLKPVDSAVERWTAK